MQNRSNKKIAIIASSAMFVRVFLAHQIHALSQCYSVTVVVNLGEREAQDMLDCLPKNVKVCSLPIEREIHLLADFRALWLLFYFFFSNKFDLIHSFTPKAGLLSVLAGWMARVSVRLHTFTGQVWAGKSGWVRAVLRGMDRLIVAFSTTVLVDSPSQKDFLVSQRVVEEGAVVLEGGSISGVDCVRFHPDPEQRGRIRKQLGIGDHLFMVLFVGRLKRDKGVIELAKAFVRLRQKRADTAMVVVGPDEESLQQGMRDQLGECEEVVHFIPFTKYPERYMAAADLFVLPSYREGFGSVVIEAAACGIPSVASRIYGLTDAVEDGVSGLLVTVQDVDELAAAMLRLAEDDEMRNRLGAQALKRARTVFSQQRLTDSIDKLYCSLLYGRSDPSFRDRNISG